MLWSYRKRIKIAPGVRLNVSKKGVSTTKDSASANGCGIFVIISIIISVIVIANGEYENPFLIFVGCVVGAAVLGFTFTAIIDSLTKNSTSAKKDEKLYQSQIEAAKNALNQSIKPIQKEILQNFISCVELNKKADETEEIIEALKKKIEKKNTSQLEELLEKYETELLKISTELDKVQLDVDKDLDDVEKGQYSILCKSFEKILSSKKIWLITSSVRNTKLKSSASNSVERKEINFNMGVFNCIKSSFSIPILRDLSNNLYFIYPRYIIKAQSFTNFEVFPIDAINFKYSKQRFIEDGVVPEDSYVIDYTYQYVNNNGEPNKRFLYNPPRPIVEYGKIEIEKFGLTYYISNDSATDKFVNIYNFWRNKSSNDKEEFIETQKDEISQDFFNEVNKSVTKISDLYYGLKNNEKFISLTQKFGLLEKDKKQLVSDLFVFDILTCYEKFNEKINLNTKSGFGLLFWLVKINTDVTIYQPNQLNIYIPTVEKMVNICLNKREFYLTVYPNTDLFIADLLNDSPEMKSKYLILLYRFFSIVAKADGNVTEDEQKWLSELLHLSENKKEEKTKKTETDFQLETKSAQKTDFQEELNSLIGLSSVKTEISTLANFIKIQQERQSKGLKTSQPSYHCVFTGNPGTGKTTVARIVAGIYKELGILKKGHLVETDRSGLVAEYVGQTAVKTNKIVDTALDGVLFIDEAYSLISNSENDYGKEAIATLLKRMEDNRDRLVVILAGYTAEMQNFIGSNSGLQSRFNRYIEFPDYSDEELYQIFELNLKQFDYMLAKDTIIPLQGFLTNTVANKDKNFGNARFVRNLFEKTIERQANRLSKEVNLTNKKLSEIRPVDIPM